MPEEVSRLVERASEEETEKALAEANGFHHIWDAVTLPLWNNDLPVINALNAQTS